jgi:exosortase K
VTLKLGVLAAAAAIVLGFKLHYSAARADDLAWILGPTARLAGVITNTPFEWQPGEGYFSRERLFLIEKSCAGVNFLIAAFAMLVLTLLHQAGGRWSAARVLGVSLLSSYAAAVAVNAMRISLAIWLGNRPFPESTLSAAALHRVEGIAVYFAGLLLLYEAAHRLQRRAEASRLIALPLGSYYAVTLALPFANGAASSDGWTQHAMVVLLVPPILIVLAFAARACCSPRLARAAPLSRGLDVGQ